MPHIILEHSDNIEISNSQDLFRDIHQILVDTLPTKLEACKSRIIKYENYYLGDGNDNNAFVNMHIRIMSGRNEEILNKAASLALEKLKEYFLNNYPNLNISVEISELSKSYYKN